VSADPNNLWQDSGPNLVYTQGIVGIGTSSPCAKAKLHVVEESAGFGCFFTAGIYGESKSNVGVWGLSGSNDAVLGYSGSGAGVFGFSQGNTGVVSASVSGTYIFEGFDNSANSKRRFDVERATGNVKADGSFTSPADFAEMMTVAGSKSDYQPGDVLIIGPDGKLTWSTAPYATNLAGVYSARPGFLGDTLITEGGLEAQEAAQTQNRVAVALMGIVPVKVSAENGAIQPGDLLTTSSTRGTAMKATDPKIGTILGKALEPLAQGTGVIKVLVTLR
jgi:hypothetical protein